MVSLWSNVKCEVDREKIMLKDPWILFHHYLAVARCTLDFASPLTKVEKNLV